MAAEFYSEDLRIPMAEAGPQGLEAFLVRPAHRADVTTTGMIAAGHSGGGLATASFGKTSCMPMLWVYATKDPFFGPDLARRFYDGFLSAVDDRLAGGARPISTDDSSRAIGAPRLARLLSRRTAQDQQSSRLLVNSKDI